MKELLVATGNKGKMAEIVRILQGCVDQLFSQADFPDLPEVVEDGETFETNARKKALSAARATGLPSLADDSGLVVDALGGRPGVLSARYAGVNGNDAANNEKLIEEMKGVAAEKRTAAFHCAVALCYPDGSCQVFHGELKGSVLEEPRGAGGFGYDPYFFVPEYGKTLAELDLDTKNGISHRGKALDSLRKYLVHAKNP